MRHPDDERSPGRPGVPKIAHVFVCYGSVSWDAAIRISEALGLSPQSLFVLALFNADPRAWPPEARVYSLNARRYSEWTRSFRVARWYRHVLWEIEVAGFQSYCAYAPHPFEIPANDLMYGNPKVHRRELLPDGMINYIPNPVVPENLAGRLRYYFRVCLRMLAAAAVGLRYRPLTAGPITQVETMDYDRAWATWTTGFLAPSSGVTLLPPKEASSSQKKRRGVLFLDQELSELVNRGLEEELRSRLHTILARLGRPVYYRAHPRGTNRSKELPLPVDDVSRAPRAEDIIDSLSVEAIVGFYSTPLLFPLAGVRRIAVLPELDSRGVRKRRLLGQLRSALAASGAEIPS